ncbi:MAG: hypothetical protein AAGD86_01390 [Pseudomonadota bacterium]
MWLQVGKRYWTASLPDRCGAAEPHAARLARRGKRGDTAAMANGITPCDLPPGALLARYSEDRGPTYVDCFEVLAGGDHALGDYVAAFYTSWLFRLERWVLKTLAGWPSTDADVDALAAGTAAAFAAWRVEERRKDQLLLCDRTGRTRSWLMAKPVDGGGTRLWFGSAVLPRRAGDRSLGPLVTGPVPFHRLYSRALLRCAHRALQARPGTR